MLSDEALFTMVAAEETTGLPDVREPTEGATKWTLEEQAILALLLLDDGGGSTEK